MQIQLLIDPFIHFSAPLEIWIEGYDEYNQEWVGNFLTKQLPSASNMKASTYFYLRVVIHDTVIQNR